MNKESLIEKIKTYSYDELYKENYPSKEDESKILNKSNFLSSIFTKKYLKEQVLKVEKKI